MNSKISGLSTVGLVSGLITIVVIPPFAAATPADLKLSLWRSPGSPTLTPMSTMPGAKQFCSQSIILSILRSKDELLLYIPVILSFSINTEPSESV